MWWPSARSGGLGMAAMAYVAVDYLRHLSPTWHDRLQPALWILLALVAVSRVPFYKHWSSELGSALPFVGSMLFMLSTLFIESLSVRSVTAVLGLDWHRYYFELWTHFLFEYFCSSCVWMVLLSWKFSIQMMNLSNIWSFAMWFCLSLVIVIWVDWLLPCLYFILLGSSLICCGLGLGFKFER